MYLNGKVSILHYHIRQRSTKTVVVKSLTFYKHVDVRRPIMLRSNLFHP